MPSHPMPPDFGGLIGRRDILPLKPNSGVGRAMAVLAKIKGWATSALQTWPGRGRDVLRTTEGGLVVGLIVGATSAGDAMTAWLLVGAAWVASLVTLATESSLSTKRKMVGVAFATVALGCIGGSIHFRIKAVAKQAAQQEVLNKQQTTVIAKMSQRLEEAISEDSGYLQLERAVFDKDHHQLNVGSQLIVHYLYRNRGRRAVDNSVIATALQVVSLDTSSPKDVVRLMTNALYSEYKLSLEANNPRKVASDAPITGDIASRSLSKEDVNLVASGGGGLIIVIAAGWSNEEGEYQSHLTCNVLVRTGTEHDVTRLRWQDCEARTSTFTLPSTANTR